MQPKFGHFFYSCDQLRQWVKAHKVFHALLVWIALCVPGNIVTFVMYHQVYSSPGDGEQVI